MGQGPNVEALQRRVDFVLNLGGETPPRGSQEGPDVMAFLVNCLIFYLLE